MSRVVGWPGGAAPQVELDRCRGLAGSVHALSDEEVASLVFALSFAGHETTTSLLGNTLRQLLLRPELWKRPCADRWLIDGAIEETLRYDTPVHAWRRVTTRPTTLGGVSLPEGARLVLAFGAGNHDASRFRDPDRFDIGRPEAKRQISFGKDIHYCLGAAPGRLEARIVIGMLADRLPGLRLVDGQSSRFPCNISFRGPLELWVEWRTAGAARLSMADVQLHDGHGPTGVELTARHSGTADDETAGVVRARRGAAPMSPSRPGKE